MAEGGRLHCRNTLAETEMGIRSHSSSELREKILAQPDRQKENTKQELRRGERVKKKKKSYKAGIIAKEKKVNFIAKCQLPERRISQAGGRAEIYLNEGARTHRPGASRRLSRRRSIDHWRKRRRFSVKMDTVALLQLADKHHSSKQSVWLLLLSFLRSSFISPLRSCFMSPLRNYSPLTNAGSNHVWQLSPSFTCSAFRLCFGKVSVC